MFSPPADQRPIVGRIDVHTHLLPGVDDGCTSVAESIACGFALVDAGYTHAFCTPHVWPNLPENNSREIRQRVRDLQREFDRAGVQLTLLPGGENNLMSAWPDIQDKPRWEVVSYAQGGRWVLFDFWAETASQVRERVEPAVRHLRGQGFELILAHPERIAAIQSDAQVLDRLTGLGVKLQLNSWCLTERKGTPKRDVAESLLREGRYFLIGTDLHRLSGMGARVEGLAIAERLVGRDEVERLTVTNPRQLMEGKPAR
ncbi:MAG TPA: CpsB/CapC family capsule biosynthesis tyrosine phosphatase [Tepidisphaeraceae bacterium]